jgi:hypothetical protein
MSGSARNDMYQKEGNGNIHTVLRIRHRSVINIRNISSYEGVSRL